MLSPKEGACQVIALVTAGSGSSLPLAWQNQCSIARALPHSLACSLAHSLTHSLTHPLTQSLTYSLTQDMTSPHLCLHTEIIADLVSICLP